MMNAESILIVGFSDKDTPGSMGLAERNFEDVFGADFKYVRYIKFGDFNLESCSRYSDLVLVNLPRNAGTIEVQRAYKLFDDIAGRPRLMTVFDESLLRNQYSAVLSVFRYSHFALDSPLRSSGCLSESARIIAKMPSSANISTLTTLVSNCPDELIEFMRQQHIIKYMKDQSFKINYGKSYPASLNFLFNTLGIVNFSLEQVVLFTSIDKCMRLKSNDRFDRLYAQAIPHIFKKKYPSMDISVYVEKD